MMTGQVGPSTALKWRISGMMLPDRRVSTITATLSLVVIFTVGGCFLDFDVGRPSPIPTCSRSEEELAQDAPRTEEMRLVERFIAAQIKITNKTSHNAGINNFRGFALSKLSVLNSN